MLLDFRFGEKTSWEKLDIMKKDQKLFQSGFVSDGTAPHCCFVYLDIINGKIGLFGLVYAAEECNINLEFAPFPHFISDVVPGVPPVFMLVSTDDVMLIEL